MATKTLGTNLTTSLTALAMVRAGGSPTDEATLANSIKSDGNVEGSNSPFGKGQVWPGAWDLSGLLLIPNRGLLQVFPGDWIGVDNQGWPILVSSNSIANGNWTHN